MFCQSADWQCRFEIHSKNAVDKYYVTLYTMFNSSCRSFRVDSKNGFVYLSLNSVYKLIAPKVIRREIDGKVNHSGHSFNNFGCWFK